LEKLEGLLLDIIIATSQFCKPLTAAEGLELTNSLIMGSTFQKDVIDFQKQYCKGTMKKDTEVGKLGLSYWNNFMHRHEHIIVSKCSEKFASSHDQWSTYDNFAKMYDKLYKEMRNAGLTKDMETPVMMDLIGNTVDIANPLAYGLPVSQQLVHPDYLLFLDETGINTNQKNDGHVGGEKFLCVRGTTPKIGCSTSDHHCTVIPIVTASGKHVCYVVIFQGDGDSPPADWCLGCDIRVVPEKDGNHKIAFGGNHGTNKYFPGGPTCFFLEKEIKCMLFVSESSGITGNILVQILKQIDEQHIFVRGNGMTPMIILDGHDSRSLFVLH